MATSEAQKRATAKWQKLNTKSISIRFMLPGDADVLEWLSKQPNKAGYIKDLVRADMERKLNAE